MNIVNINRLILRYICEILIVVLFVIISIPLWKKFDKSDIANIANSYHEMNYLYLEIDKYIENVDFKDVVAVVNNTNTQRDYKLILKVSKEKISDNLMIEINNEIKLLKELVYKEDDKYNYYIIAKGNVVAAQNDYKVNFINSNISYNDVEYEIIESHKA